jgi:hypothetical protein
MNLDPGFRRGDYAWLGSDVFAVIPAKAGIQTPYFEFVSDFVLRISDLT